MLGVLGLTPGALHVRDRVGDDERDRHDKEDGEHRARIALVAEARLHREQDTEADGGGDAGHEPCSDAAERHRGHDREQVQQHRKADAAVAHEQRGAGDEHGCRDGDRQATPQLAARLGRSRRPSDCG